MADKHWLLTEDQLLLFAQLGWEYPLEDDPDTRQEIRTWLTDNGITALHSEPQAVPPKSEAGPHPESTPSEVGPADYRTLDGRTVHDGDVVSPPMPRVPQETGAYGFTAYDRSAGQPVHPLDLQRLEGGADPPGTDLSPSQAAMLDHMANSGIRKPRDG